MKFYTNFDRFNFHNFEHKTIYKINHMFFYICLLPYDLKLQVINSLSSECKDIYKDLLKNESVFCENIEDSDYVVLSYLSIMKPPRRFFSLYADEIELALKYNKKILYFYGGDNDMRFNIPSKRGYVFRNSGFLSEKSENVFSIPTFSKDYFDGDYLKKNLSLSFCGYPKSSSEGIALKSRYFQIREKVINQLIDFEYSNFILRKSWGGIIDDPFIPTNFGEDGKRYKTVNITMQYMENLKSSLYCLCIRGGGNYSFRLGEILMMGRIPVLIDTDCILPFYDIIDYKKQTVYVDKNNSKNFTDIDSVIQEFHHSHSEDELIEIQKENRKIWEKYFNPLHSFKYICSLLDKKTI